MFGRDMNKTKKEAWRKHRKKRKKLKEKERAERSK